MKIVNFQNVLENYHLTTAELLYYLPDHPLLLQSYIWQDFDLPPEFPKLKEFVTYWTKSIEGPLHSVRIMCGNRPMDHEYTHALFFEQIS
jgi:uncharacterized protein Usg